MARHARAPSSPWSRVPTPAIRGGPAMQPATAVAAAALLGLAMAGVILSGAPAGGGPGLAAGARAVPPPASPDAGIPDVPWLVDRGDGRWVYGRGTSAAPRALPADESGIAIDPRYVASTVPNAAGRSTLRVRDRVSGRRIADVDAPIWIAAGAWTSRGLVVTGYPDSSMQADGGLVLFAMPDLAARVLVPSRPFPAQLGTPVARGDVVVSPSGRFAGSNLCGVHLCDTQVVDLTTEEVFRPIQGAEGFLRVLTDDVVVTTDGDFAWISARRIRDGREAWRATDSILLDPVAAADGSVVAVVGSRTAGWGVASFDAGGRGRDLTKRTGTGEPWPRIWREVSTPTAAVVGREGFREALGSSGIRSVTVLGLTGSQPSTRPATFTLPTTAEGIER